MVYLIYGTYGAILNLGSIIGANVGIIYNINFSKRASLIPQSDNINVCKNKTCTYTYFENNGITNKL